MWDWNEGFKYGLMLVTRKQSSLQLLYYHIALKQAELAIECRSVKQLVIASYKVHSPYHAYQKRLFRNVV